MDCRDAANYWWQGLIAASIPAYIAGLLMMAADASRFPWVAATPVSLMIVALVPWAISMVVDRTVVARRELASRDGGHCVSSNHAAPGLIQAGRVSGKISRQRMNGRRP
jgi:hypothetical protein